MRQVKNIAEEKAKLSLATRLDEALKAKIPANEITEILKGSKMKRLSEEAVLSTFMEVLLNISQKTISFSFCALTRFFSFLY